MIYVFHWLKREIGSKLDSIIFRLFREQVDTPIILGVICKLGQRPPTSPSVQWLL